MGKQDTHKSQADKFREAAKEHEADNDEKTFDELVKKIAQVDSSGGRKKSGKKRKM